MDDSSQDIETGKAIDRICDEFERAWQQGQNPLIESSLREFAPIDSETLLKELLEIEFEYRLVADGDIDEQSYVARFAAHVHLVKRSVLSAHARLLPRQPRVIATRDVNETPLWRNEPGLTISDTVRANIEDYEILEVLGRGGMGTVYKARQISVNRIVALKVIRPDLIQNVTADDEQSTSRRFMNEATAVARIEHENVVRAYDAGRNGTNHYFAMQYVDGASLATKLREGPVPPRLAAEWMKGVAEGLAAAHERGILHRDIKPANILIENKTQKAMLLDFGLAKLVEEAGTFTRPGELLGSPHYMSPEQATDAAQVGRESDIYGMGATLYHALTGRPPFQASSAGEILRQVQNEPPCEPRRLVSSLSKDLETICLKCLEKSPHKRYSSALELAAELQRFLKSEPIRARPVSQYEKGARWCQRYPLAATLLATTTLLLFSTIIAVGIGLTSTYLALHAERRERLRAEENLGMARDSVDKFLRQLSKDPRLKAKGLERLRQELLSAATVYYEAFVQQKAADDDVMADRGRALASLGALTAELGEPQLAVSRLTDASKIFRQLVDSHPDNTDFLVELATSLIQLAGLYHDIGKSDLATEHCRRALQICESGKTGPPQKDFERLLVRCLVVQARVREMDHAEDAVLDLKRASASLERLLAVQPDDLSLQEELARCHNNLAVLQRHAGNLDAAENESWSAVKLWQKLCRENSLTQRVEQLGIASNNLAIVLLDRNREEAADRVLHDSLGCLSGLVAEHPDVPDFRDDLAASFTTRARWLEAMQRWDESTEVLRIAIGHYEALTADYPEYVDYQIHLAASLNNLARLILNSSEWVEAERILVRAERINRQVAARNPSRESIRHQHSLILANLAASYVRKGEFDVAIACWEDAAGFAPEKLKPLCRIQLALALARAGKHVNAAAMLIELQRTPTKSGLSLHFARAWALCAAAAESDKQISDDNRFSLARNYASNAASSLRTAMAAERGSALIVREEARNGDDFAILRKYEPAWGIP